MTVAPFTITFQLAREPLPVTGERQAAYLLLEARPAAPDAAVPLNLTLVLDRSGSMRGPRLEQLKAALIEVIDTLRPDDIIAIVTFDDMVDRLVPAQPVGDDRAALVAAVGMIAEGGGTAMSLGMSLGLAELRRYAGPGYASRMLLLSDGVSRDDAAQCRELAESAGADGLPIVTLGFGAEWDDAQLEEIGLRSGGPPPEYIRTPVEVGPCLQRQLRAARSTVAQQLRLEAHFVAGVTPHRVTLVSPFTRLLDDGIQGAALDLALGVVERDLPYAVLVELIIEPKRSGTFRIAQVDGHARGLDGEACAAQADVVVTFSASASKRPQPRPAVLHYVERATTARVVLRALADHTPIAESSRALFDGESREALEALVTHTPLTPEDHKALLARIRDLARIRRPAP